MRERTTPVEARRKRIASVPFRELEKRGFTIEAEAPEKFKFTLLGVSIEVVFRERLEMVVIRADSKRPYSYDRKEWRGTGMLRLRFENYFDVAVRREFCETSEKRFESILRDIIIALYIAVEAERERNERFEEECRIRREAEQRRWEIEERRRKEQERLATLKSEAKAWEEARRLCAYIAAAVEADASQEWAIWASAIADALDPLKRAV
jgi:hypothetical protein